MKNKILYIAIISLVFTISLFVYDHVYNAQESTDSLAMIFFISLIYFFISFFFLNILVFTYKRISFYLTRK